MLINKKNEYKHDEFIHFVRQKNGEIKLIDAKKGSKRKYKGYDMIEIPFEEIVELNLNDRGTPAPYTNRNVISVSRYLFWYWMPIIGSDAVNLYILLTEYCDDETDICYPSISELAQRMGRSVPTINKNLDKLEENNFILVINRLNKKSNNRETTPIFKIRHSIPLLSKEQYKMLPEYLQKKHDKFMEKYCKNINMDYFNYNSEGTLEELLEHGKEFISKKHREKSKKALEEGKAVGYILTKLSDSQIMKIKELHDLLQKQWSKPTFDTALFDSISIYDEDNRTVYFILNSFGKAIMEESPLSYERLLPLFRILYGDGVLNIQFYTFDEYLYKLGRGE